MNFTCDNCQKRYSIADEKVRGKTVKVRCKNCQNVISVEGPAAEESTRVVSLADVERLRAQERSLAEPAASAPEPAAAPAVAKAPPAALQTPWDDEPTRAAPLRATGSPWFVMVRNKQEGPLDEGGLRELIATGAISGRSFFWQQGMADWKRGSDVPELAALFAPPPAPEPPPPPPPVPEPAPAPRAARPARREPE
ncbi:zinc-ribbon domain-containing protein, partial [Myxococcus sp. K15C18031901]|uniref:GYF domain-containing protein n=1 Tax=Myxococcus dinghuensis TaxID=2906761 RepID=UPI0020A8324E